MARTQAADYDLRRLAIVEAAAELYAQFGFLGASLVDLAERCKSSKSLIYHYYGSKEDILFDVMSSHIEALNAAADDVMAQALPAREKLRALAHTFMELYVGASARHKVLLNELDHLPPTRRAQIVARQRRLITVVEDLLGEIRPELKRSKGLIRPTAMLFFGMINWTHTWFDPKGQASPATVADLTVDIMLVGLDGLALPRQASAASRRSAPRKA
jgi:AcrR family transcriptional regulator